MTSTAAAERATVEPAPPLGDVTEPPRAAWIERVFAPHDTFGPKVRMGIIWFGLELGALGLGRFALGVLFGLVAGVAGLQSAREWRRAGWQPSRLVAGLAGLLIPFSAALGVALAGVVVLVAVVAALVVPLGRPRRRRRTPWLGAAGTTIRCGLFAGVTGAMPVLVYRANVAAAIVLVILVSAYEMGDFLNGSEAVGLFAGPAAGIICVVVVTFAVGVVVPIFEIEPFQSAAHAWVLGALVAVLCPLSQLMASLLLPRAGARAPALRRLDSYLLTGPAWLWLLWSFLG